MLIGSVCATSTQSTVTAEKHIAFSQEGTHSINMDTCSFDYFLITCLYFLNKMWRKGNDKQAEMPQMELVISEEGVNSSQTEFLNTFEYQFMSLSLYAYNHSITAGGDIHFFFLLC